MTDYYDHGGVPADASYGDSAVIRAEFTAIQNGISKKLPVISGNPGKIIAVNAGATKLESVATTGTGAVMRSNNPALVSPTGLVKGDVGLGNVDNTSDANKPVSTAQATAIGNKANKGANNDITSLSGLTTALSIAQGGTGGTSQATAQAALGVPSTADVTAEIAAAVAAIPLSPSHNFRNRIVNGNFIVDQEYVAASTTFTSGAAYKRAIDMWYAYCTGANVTGQQITSGGGKRYRFTGAASNTAVGFVHSIEAKNSADLAGGDATLSVLLSSSSITTVNWQAYYANTTDTFGTLASPTRTSIASGSFTITSTETLYQAVLTGISSSATTGIEVVFTVGALTATNTLTFGNVQLEKGDIALADVVFETVEYSTQLTRCLYGWYEKCDMVVNTASAYISQVSFVKKRTTPTVGTPGFNTGSGATFSLVGVSTIYQSANHSAIASATIPLTCGLHG